MTATPVFDEIIDLIAKLPPKELLDFHLSKRMQSRLESLLEKEQDKTISADELSELEKYMMLEHIFRMAKARALKKIRA